MASIHEISSLYTRYKIGQKHVSQWLLNATNQHPGHAAESRVSPTEMCRLADEFVENAETTGKTPDGLHDSIRVLESVLRGRKACSVWYRHAESEEHDGRRTRGHQGAIAVLHSVLAKLKRVQGPTCGRDQELSPRSLNTNPLTNFFRALPFEHIEDAGHTGSPIRKSESSAYTVAAVQGSTTLECAQEEGSLALECLFEDFTVVREHLRTTVWASYQDGTIALPHASLLTETASLNLELAVSAVTEDFPALNLYSNIAEHLGLKVATEQLRGNQDTLETTADALCVPAWMLLRLLRTQLECLENTTSAASAHLFDVTKQIREFHYLGEVSLNLQPQILALSNEHQTVRCLDLFTKSMVRFYSDRSITTRLVFDVQIQLDILTHRGREGSNCSNVLMTVAKYTMGQIQLYDAKRIPCSPEHRQKLEQYVTEATGMTLDQFEKQPGGTVDSLAASLPLLAGAYIDAIQQDLHFDGADLCNQDSIVVATAHLYKALQATGSLETSWSDMDKFIAVQDPKALGFQEVANDTSSTMFRAAKHYGIAMGVTPSQYAPTQSRARNAAFNRVALPSTSDNREPSKYKGMVHVSSTLIVKMLAEFGEFAELDYKMAPRMPAVLHAVIRDLVPRHPHLFDAAFEEACGSNEGLTPIQALYGLQQSLELNEAAVNFDLHGLFATSCMALGEVNAKLCGKLAEGFEPREMIDEILWSGANREAGGWSAKNDPLVRGASQAMESYLKEHGESCQAQSKEMTSACRKQASTLVATPAPPSTMQVLAPATALALHATLAPSPISAPRQRPAMGGSPSKKKRGNRRQKKGN